MTNFQQEQKERRISTDQLQHAQYLKSQLWFARTDKFGYPPSHEVNKVVAEIRKQERMEREAAREAARRRENLSSNNIFTLISMVYENPADAEAIKLVREMLLRLHISGKKYPVLDKFDDVTFDMEQTIENRVTFPMEMTEERLERELNSLGKDLPQERKVYNDLKHLLGSK